MFVLMGMQGQMTIPLWPKGVPGEKTATGPEKDMTTSKDGLVAGQPVLRIGNVAEPSITVYRPAQEASTGTSVIVFPGGGYRILAMDLEGTEVCQWLNTLGITAILLKYRVPEPAQGSRYAEPLQDAERAISLARLHAREWHLRADRVGVMGFSAGGHLSAVLSNNSAARTYPKIDEADQGTLRPNFTMLIYPAYLSVNDEGRELAPEVKVSAQAPPTFIVQAENDHHFVGGTLLYYRALEQARVPAEMHLFAEGGHGYGLRHTEKPVTGWPELAEGWLRSNKLLDARSGK